MNDRDECDLGDRRHRHLGRVVVGLLLEAGHEVRIASRRPQPAGESRPYTWMTVDYRSGAGLAEAVAGADAIVHCAGDLRGEVERQLVAAARGAGSPHLVHISIVGVDPCSARLLPWQARR